MKNWWGTFDLPKNGVLQKQIGPLWLAIKQNKREWQIYYDRISDWHDELRVGVTPSQSFILGAETLKERYVLNENALQVTLMPSLADRAVVVRPVTPFYVPQHQSTTIFVSTPLWVNITIGNEHLKLTEIPVLVPSDTWFGTNTRQGKLCYASQTSARLSANELPKRAHRAITPVHILNESSSHLLLERINIPVPLFQVYEAATKQLWTQSVTMIRKADEETATLEIIDGPPAQAQEATLLTEARETIQEKTIIRTISGFFA